MGDTAAVVRDMDLPTTCRKAAATVSSDPDLGRFKLFIPGSSAMSEAASDETTLAAGGGGKEGSRSSILALPEDNGDITSSCSFSLVLVRAARAGASIGREIEVPRGMLTERFGLPSDLLGDTEAGLETDSEVTRRAVKKVSVSSPNPISVNKGGN